MKNYYVYVYLDPRFINYQTIENIKINYRIIYVGKGKNTRIYDHIKHSNLEKNNIKNNTIKKLIELYSIEKYKAKYIIKIKDGLTDNQALELEYKVMKKIGTFIPIHKDIKKGTLLNSTLCGVKI